MKFLSYLRESSDIKKLTDSLLNWKDDDEHMEQLEKFLALFSFSGKAPRGFVKEFNDLKMLKSKVAIWYEYGAGVGIPQPIGATLSYWNQATIDRIIDGFLTKDKKVEEISYGNITFKNQSSMAESRFIESSKSIDSLLKRFHGEYAKALKGTVTIIFKAAKDMKSKAVYKSQLDQIWVKESPNIAKDVHNEKYAYLSYIIVHELLHRYERFYGRPSGYNSREFFTTDYSRKDTMSGGEDFAEIGALSFFGPSVHPDYNKWLVAINRFKSIFK